MVGTLPTRIVDASGLAGLVFREPEAEDIARRVEGASLVAPRILEFEVGNVCLTKLRRQPQRRSELLTAYHWRSRIWVTTMTVDHDGVLALAEQAQLTFYDASYLWLTRSLNAEL